MTLLNPCFAHYRYGEALDLICRHCSAQFEASKDQNLEGLEVLSPAKQLQLFASITLPEETALEIVAKLCITLVRLIQCF